MPYNKMALASPIFLALALLMAALSGPVVHSSAPYPLPAQATAETPSEHAAPIVSGHTS